MSDFYSVVIEEDTANISNLETFWEFFRDNFFWPLRYYYKLVKKDGTVRTDLTEDKGIDDYYYTSYMRKYYKNDDGWFWGKSIPKDLYNAIAKGQLNHEKGLIEAEKDALEAEKNEMQETGADDDEITELEEDIAVLEERITQIEEDYEERVNEGFGSESEENEAAEGVLEILQAGHKITTDDFIKYLPIILRVKEHWYEDLRYDQQESGTVAPCYKWEVNEDNVITSYPYVASETDTKAVSDAANAGMMYIDELAPGRIVQVAKPKTQFTGVYLDSLLSQEYYIYDGRSRSEEKRKIDFQNMAVDAIAMLEQIQGEDAQQIIRMFKLYMATKGVYFEITGATGVKKAICSKIMDRQDWDCKLNLLVEDESSYVLRADIPPTQYGFPTYNTDHPVYVLAPVNGEVVYRSDDCVCIKITDETITTTIETGGGKEEEVIVTDDEGEEVVVTDWTILISGFKVNSTLKEGDTVSERNPIGQTVKRDIKMVLRDENGAIIKNTYKATNNPNSDDNPDEDTILALDDIYYDEHQGNLTSSVNGHRTADDIYYVVEQSGVFNDTEKARIGGPDGEYIQALVEMEENYGIDPLWALSKSHWESHCGTAYEGEHRLFNIRWWTGIRGYAGESNNFATYTSDREAILDFGNYAVNRWDRMLTTVDDFEEYAGIKLFENTKKKDYPTYLKLKTTLSSKGV